MTANGNGYIRRSTAAAVVAACVLLAGAMLTLWRVDAARASEIQSLRERDARQEERLRYLCNTVDEVRGEVKEIKDLLMRREGP